MHKLTMFATLDGESRPLSGIKGKRAFRIGARSNAELALLTEKESKKIYDNDRRTMIEALFRAVHCERIKHLALPTMDIIVHPHGNIGLSRSIRIVCKNSVTYRELVYTLSHNDDRFHAGCSNHNFVCAEITLEHQPGSEIVVPLKQQYAERRQESAFAQDIRRRLQVLFSEKPPPPPVLIEAETPQIRQHLMDILHHSPRVQARLQEIGFKQVLDDSDKGVILIR